MTRAGFRNGTARDFFERSLLRTTDECIIWPYGKTTHGYGMMYLAGGMKGVHRLALRRMIGPPPPGRNDAIHGPCHAPACFNPRHLRWGTRAENMADRHRDGTHQWGEGNSFVKLTEVDVRAIRAAIGVPQKELARRYRVNQSTISDIINRVTWKLLDDEMTPGTEAGQLGATAANERLDAGDMVPPPAEPGDY